MADGRQRAGTGRFDGEGIDLCLGKAHSARVYDALLGGKTHYAPDREAVAQLLKRFPRAREAASTARAFMHRAARYLAAEAGIRQFLDIGSGIPTQPNLHEVVQEIAPESRVVYVDNDPIVLAHSRALHVGHAAGRTAYVHADLCQPASILDDPQLRETLDLSQPVALTLLAVLYWLPADTDPYGVVEELLAALPSGSHLVISHLTGDFDPPVIDAVARDFSSNLSDVSLRSRTQVEAFFEGLRMVEPGVQAIEEWRPDRPTAGGAAHPFGNVIPMYGGMAEKP